MKTIGNIIITIYMRKIILQKKLNHILFYVQDEDRILILAIYFV